MSRKQVNWLKNFRRQVRPALDERLHESAPGPTVITQRRFSFMQIALECNRRAVVEGMSQGARRVNPFESVIRPVSYTHLINDNASVTRGIVERAAAAGAVRVWPIGAASVGSKGEALAEIAAMKDAGIVAVSDDGKPVATARLMRQVMDYCRALNLPVIDHCEDPSLFAGGVMREGPRSIRCV